MEFTAEQTIAIILKDGANAIARFIDEKRAEDTFLDFKEKTRIDGTAKLSDDDKKNYEMALSGFANTEGGVLIWGVKAKTSEGKVAVEDRAIKNVDNFLAELNHILHQAVDPPVIGAANSVVKNNQSSGYVISFVPKSLSGRPHRAELKSKKYFHRIGDSFVVMKHSQIEEMFRTRNLPSVSASFGFREGHSPDRKNLHKYELVIELTNGPITVTSFGIDLEFPAEALKDENSLSSLKCQIDTSYDTDNNMALIKCRSKLDQAPLFPGEKIKIIPNNYFAGHIRYHVNNHIYRLWQGIDLQAAIYADSMPPNIQTISFDQLNNF